MKSILFTGSSGFIGKNIMPVFKEKGLIVDTLDLINADYSCDLSKSVPELNNIYDVILHAAGKAHSIPETYEENQSFFDINFQGTRNLCAGLEKNKLPKSFIFISTVAVYGRDQGEEITEDHPLNGRTPYALSKLQAEYFLSEWCDKHKVTLSIIRPSLIAGPNPPGNLGAMINGMKTGRYLIISGVSSRKSVLMVQDIAAMVPLLAVKGGVYNVCDNIHPTFRDIEKLIALQLGKPLPFSITLSLAKVIARIGDLRGNRALINTMKLNKIIQSLTFSNNKARKELGWEPTNVLDNFVIK